MKGGSGSRLYREKGRFRQAGIIRGAVRPGGFTIIEVLIVIAVSGAMFTSALLLINGKQSTTSFNQSIRSIQTQMQQVMNDVGSGYYPNNGNLMCEKNGPNGGLLLTSPSSGAPEQGSNKDCIFLGKVVHFGVDAANPDLVNVYLLAGLSGGQAGSADLVSAKARLVAQGTDAADAGIPDATETLQLQYGLTVSQMYYGGNTNNKIGAVGFVSSMNSLGSADSSQQVNVVAVTGTPLGSGLSQQAAVKAINDNWDTNPADSILNPAGGVQICFNSGDGRKSGLITLGGTGRQGAVELKIFNQVNCT